MALIALIFEFLESQWRHLFKNVYFYPSDVLFSSYGQIYKNVSRLTNSDSIPPPQMFVKVNTSIFCCILRPLSLSNPSDKKIETKSSAKAFAVDHLKGL